MLHSELFGCHLMVAATIPKDGPVTRSQPSLGAQRIETRVASGSITVPDKVVGRAVARSMQIEG